MKLPNITWFRSAQPNDPELPRRIAETFQAAASQSAITESQGNLNPLGPPEPPPNIQSVTATGQNGVLHVAIQDQSEGLSQGANYYIEHSAFSDFRDAQIRNIGDSRSYTEFIGNAARFVRAYSAYPSSRPSAHVYHGSPTAPIAVSGGGSIGPPAYLPSQGSGTGAPGQAGVGPGPLPKRTVQSGVAWRGQQPTGPSGVLSTGNPVIPVSSGLAPSGTAAASGSGVLPPASAAVLATSSSGSFIAASLPSAEIWIGSVGSLPVAHSVTGDITVSATGATIVIQVNGGAVPASASPLATNASGQIVAASGFTGTLAAAIAAGKNVTNGLIDP